MRYWLTTHWPPTEDYPDPTGVYLPDGRQAAGQNLRREDTVFVYESRTGPIILERLPDGTQRQVRHLEGREGIIAVTEALDEIQQDRRIEPTEYVGRNPIRWCWFAPTRENMFNGFVPRREVNRILGYHLNNPMRGFGTLHSGLKEISIRQAHAIIAFVNQNSI